MNNVSLPGREQLRELHCFCGSGGGVLGGILLGHRTVCAVEIEPYRRKVLLQRQRDGILPRFPIWDDIRTFDGKPWRGKVDVVSGGFPCQGISCAGKGLGLEDDRSGLWHEMARVVREVGPEIVFVENSPMLTLRGLGRVLSDLAEMGYDAKWGVFAAEDACWFDGTPVADHQRERLFIYGTNTHANGSRKLQPEGIKQDIWKRFFDPREAVSNAECVRQQGSRQYDEPVCSEAIRDGETNISRNGGWWGSEPEVCRVADGIPNRMDRLGAIGDAQVPAVVVLAWNTLIQ